MILTSRLRLRALTLNDLALFRALYCDPGTMRHIGKPMSRARAAASLGATIAATRKPGGLRFYTIVERQSRRGVGMCSLRPAARDKRGVELGIMLVRNARGRGYAREAFAALIDDAFFRLPIAAVWVQHSRANAEAARLNDALGFHPIIAKRLHGARRGQRAWVLRRPKQHGSPHQPTKGKAMSNIIGFLEQAGRNAAMRHASREALLKAMHEEEIVPAQRSVLDNLTGARETMYAVNLSIKPPKKAPAKKKPAKAPPKKKPAKKAPAKKPAKKAPAKRKR